MMSANSAHHGDGQTEYITRNYVITPPDWSILQQQLDMPIDAMYLISSTLLSTEKSESFEQLTHAMTNMLTYLRQNLMGISTKEEMDAIMAGCTSD
jgi:hypothetical protein